MKNYEIPGLALGIVKDGQKYLTKGYGVKNLVTRELITDRCLFHMASVSKPFVATAIMQLAEAEKIDLDAPVTTYLPYFKMKDPRFRQITVRQMLTHTSGMPDVEINQWENPQYDDGALTRYVLSLEQVDLLFSPGEKWKFSNIAYDVLGNLIAKVTQMTFEDYMDKYILSPLDMKQSTFFKGKANKVLCTSPHIRKLEPVVSDTYPYNRSHAPSSTLHSSVTEMCNYALANLNRGSFDNSSILKAISFNTMWRPVCDASEGKKMGLSWFICEREGDLVVNHSGGDLGFRTNFCLVPNRMAAIIVLSNYELTPTQEISMAVWDIISGKKPESVKIPVMIPMSRILVKNDVSVAIEHYNELKAAQAANYDFSMEQLDLLGYQLLGQVRITEAIEIFKLNAMSFPESDHVYESLGEAYLLAGQNEAAIENYEKSLVLNPDNQNALIMLKKIREETAVGL
jgi:CubicO group peptidase (beta-lactamase class C family)